MEAKGAFGYKIGYGYETGTQIADMWTVDLPEVLQGTTLREAIDKARASQQETKP